MYYAATNGHINAVKWLYEKHGIIQNSYMMEIVVMQGHLNVLEWLHNNGFKLNTDCWTHAAEHGHLEILKYLHSNNIQMHPSTPFRAVTSSSKNKMKILEYLYSIDAPFDEACCWAVNMLRDFEVLKWLVDIEAHKKTTTIKN